MRSKKGLTGWMAVKVDLEKAYDRLRWDFIEETLYDAGLPSKFIKAVMVCVSTCNMYFHLHVAYVKGILSPLISSCCAWNVYLK
ncbi:hypothetical protein QN277_029280 [Acacia crassicarpa]|uniref:Reverse transcriptase domain-containing protein n=1 Tax=Acacia crassicarpa TaxID=499986 RepID=A0AAE1K4N1_9FABA|nr:hypothetical protein QN277_029280 [Acacia crassicarpa]